MNIARWSGREACCFVSYLWTREKIVKNLKKKSGFFEITVYKKFLGTKNDVIDEQELYGTC